MRIVLLFPSTHAVMKAERVLRTRGVRHAIIPVPKEISSECGMAIEMDPTLLDKAKEVLTDATVEFTIHELPDRS